MGSEIRIGYKDENNSYFCVHGIDIEDECLECEHDDSESIREFELMMRESEISEIY